MADSKQSNGTPSDDDPSSLYACVDKNKLNKKPVLNYVDVEFLGTSSKNDKKVVIKEEPPGTLYANVVFEPAPKIDKEKPPLAEKVTKPPKPKESYENVLGPGAQTMPEERLYRIKSSYSSTGAHSQNLEVHAGDIFLGEQEKDGCVFGTVFQKNQKGTPPQIWLPVNLLLLYQPVDTISSNQNTANKSKESPASKDKSKTSGAKIVKPSVDAKNKDSGKTAKSTAKKPTAPVLTTAVENPTAPSVIEEKNEPPDANDSVDSGLLTTLVNNSIFANVMSKHPQISSPSLEKFKFNKNDKIPKVPDEDKNEIYIFAVADRKSKEESVLSFKKYQLAVLMYTQPDRWWCIRTEDGTNGWVPADFWRFVPENRKDNVSSPDYVPWSFTGSRADCEQLMLIHGKDRDFVLRESKTPDHLSLSAKYGERIYNFRIEIKPDKTYFIGDHHFKTVFNVLIYYKKHELVFLDNGTGVALGKPFSSSSE